MAKGLLVPQVRRRVVKEKVPTEKRVMAGKVRDLRASTFARLAVRLRHRYRTVSMLAIFRLPLARPLPLRYRTVSMLAIFRLPLARSLLLPLRVRVLAATEKAETTEVTVQAARRIMDVSRPRSRACSSRSASANGDRFAVMAT